MRRMTMAMLAIGLICVGVGPAAAQSPSASPEPSPSVVALVARAEVPEARFAVTLPQGWALETEEVVERTDSPEGPNVETRSIWSYAYAFDGSASCLMWEEREEGSFDEAVASHRSRYGPVLVEMSSFELPSGRSVRFVVDYTVTGDEGVGAIYLLGDGLRLFVLTCVAVEPPANDWWLSIAETFEFLPVEE